MKLQKLLLNFVLFCAVSSTAAASPKQFARKFELDGKLGAIMLIGYEEDAAAVEKLISMAVDEAKRIHLELDYRNPQGDVGKLNALNDKVEVKLSDDVFTAFKAATRVSEWTHGAFDVTYASPDGDYTFYKLNEEKNLIKIKKAGLQFRFDQIEDGYIADVLVRFIYANGMKNVLVKMGNVFRGTGSSLYGPWKIQIQDDAGTYAHRALNLGIQNTGAAIVSRTQFAKNPLIDPRNKQNMEPSMRGNTVVMKEAALAQAYASALFVLGAKEGYDHAVALAQGKALIVDNNGTFLRTPGF